MSPTPNKVDPRSKIAAIVYRKMPHLKSGYFLWHVVLDSVQRFTFRNWFLCSVICDGLNDKMASLGRAPADLDIVRADIAKYEGLFWVQDSKDPDKYYIIPPAGVVTNLESLAKLTAENTTDGGVHVTVRS